MKKALKHISQLFISWKGHSDFQTEVLPNSGSERKYVRIYHNDTTYMAAFNENIAENKAFIDYTRQFQENHLPVPAIYIVAKDQLSYILEDLGKLSLLQWVEMEKHQKDFEIKRIKLYQKVLTDLSGFQITAGQNFDYRFAWPVKSFQKNAIIYDLNYFKKYFLENQKIKFDSHQLDNEFKLLASHLISTDTHYFMYRDFQARNILLKDDKPYYIDYQGGRMGALQYDLASLLYQAKAQLPEKIKLALLQFYVDHIQKRIPLNQDDFKQFFYSYALIRVLQTVGAYGYRGLQQKKRHFIESIPLAINNLNALKETAAILDNLPEIKDIISRIVLLKDQFEQKSKQ